MADEIQKNIVKEGKTLCADAWDKIYNTCQKTVLDLKAILIELEAFRTFVLPIDQEKRKNSMKICQIFIKLYCTL